MVDLVNEIQDKTSLKFLDICSASYMDILVHG